LGRVHFAATHFEWGIEYRDKDGSGAPADPDKTFRVLTLG
jgi:hypothetical protein